MASKVKEIKETPEQILHRKKIMSILIMVLIMIMCLILILTTFRFGTIGVEINQGSNNPVNPDNPDDPNNGGNNKPKELKALAMMESSPDLSLYLSAMNLTHVSFGTNDVVEMKSDIAKARISLLSQQGVSMCKYEVLYKPTENTFTPHYLTNKGVLAPLYERQVELNIALKKGGNNASYKIDLTNLQKEDEVSIKYFTIVDTANEDIQSETVHEWEAYLTFYNYKAYNQMNNAGKVAKGILTFKMAGCSRID